MSDSELVVPAETAMKMAEVAENNLRFKYDQAFIEQFFSICMNDKKSIAACISEVPGVLKAINDHLHLNIQAPDATQEDVAQYVQKMSFKDGDILFVDADAVDAMELSKSFPIQKGRVSIVPLVVPHGKILAECIEKREADHV